MADKVSDRTRLSSSWSSLDFEPVLCPAFWLVSSALCGGEKRILLDCSELHLDFSATIGIGQ